MAMALGSEISIERESVTWEVGPTKDVIQAFIETLVDPRLPYKSLNDHPPSEEAQKSIAQQMHAVVLLYNYYHRKQKLELEYMDFVSFCKLALSLRPALTPFMNIIRGSEVTEFDGVEDQLSFTEKAIKDARSIAMSLDASKEVPTIEGYPISKVVVLLIDSEKENCLLQFGAVTGGVWTLVEKELDEANVNKEILEEEMVGKKRKASNEYELAYHSKFLQIGFDAVKDVFGMDVSDLAVLEAHVVYSLSKEKSAAQFYMMKCKQSFNKKQQYPLESLVKSLQGPFATKYGDAWESSELVNHYCLLPYRGLISSWLPRKDLSMPILSDYVYKDVSRMPHLSHASCTFEGLDCNINSDSPNKNNILEKETTFAKKTRPNQRKKTSFGQYVNSKVETVLALEAPIGQHKVKRVPAKNGGATSSNRNGKVAAKDVHVHFEAPNKGEAENTMSSKDLQNSLVLIGNKKQELRCSQLCTIEDELASYEHLTDRIRVGGETGLAHQCIQSIISGSDHLLQKEESQPENTTIFSNIFLPGISSCEDLKDICLKNKWRMPRYLVQPTMDGKFMSNVIVCTGTSTTPSTTLSLTGALQSIPLKTRESTAAKMIAKIKALASQRR